MENRPTSVSFEGSDLSKKRDVPMCVEPIPVEAVRENLCRCGAHNNIVDVMRDLASRGVTSSR